MNKIKQLTQSIRDFSDCGILKTLKMIDDESEKMLNSINDVKENKSLDGRTSRPHKKF